MIVELLLVVTGSYLLLKGSEWVTDSSVSLAKKLGTTNLAVGLILISVMLSLPEMLVALNAFLKHHEQVSIGVSLGSVIVNLGLVLGIAAILHPIKVPRHVVSRDGIFMLVATIVVALIALEDRQITMRDGIIFLLLFIPYIINVFEQEKQLAKHEKEKEAQDLSKTLTLFGKLGETPTLKRGPWLFALGGIFLIIGAELFIRGLISAAATAGISDALIGITLGALGPSLPNLVVAFQASKKGFDEIAVSQSIGSNIFTLFVTLGFLSLLSPINITESFAATTIPVLLTVTIVSFVFLLKRKIGRKEGIVLVALYFASIAVEISSSGIIQ